MVMATEKLIDAAVRQRLIEADTLVHLRTEARRKRVDILDAITAHYRLPVTAFYRAAAEFRGLLFADATVATPPAEVLKKIPQALLRRKLIFPIAEDANGVTLAVADPDDHATIESVQRLIARNVRVAVAEPNALNAMIARTLAATSQGQASAAVSQATEVDLVALLDDILKEAFLRRASDVHIVQEEFGLRVRLRVDGGLQDYSINTEGNENVASGLISRIKVLSNLDIAEQREPQDGGMSYYLPEPIDKEFNIRIATAPTRLGERVTMRILGDEAQKLTLEKLGMSPEDLMMFRQAIRKPFGMILLTGPTGSGKSTTLFAALKEINSPDLNIMTVENPIEYVMEGVSQIQTGPKVSFAGALRSLLRHDPDVLMVGEIRDEETADVALKAAMTGHLVFSTLHTNTASGTVARLIDIGMEPFLIGATMNAVIAQRLVRCLCPHCRVERTATKIERELLDIKESDVKIYDPQGCAYCQGSGYRGRLGLFETLWFDEELSKLVSRGCTEEELESRAGNRLRSMWSDGTKKVLAGATTLAELQAVAVKREF